MKFEWDERKNQVNLRKHGFDLCDAAPMFNAPMLAQADMREDYGENRWIGIGVTHGRVAVVAFAERDEDCIRISRLERRIGMDANSSKKRSRTNWKKVDSLPDAKIDYSDVPELDAGFFRHAIRWPGKKRQITLRLDPDILAFFRWHGKGYQTTINAVLRSYMETQKDRTTSRSG